MSVLKDYIAGKATAEEVRAEVRRQREGMKKEGPPYRQPDLMETRWTPPSIFEDILLAQVNGDITNEETDWLSAP